jgi:hypothetical protein
MEGFDTTLNPALGADPSGVTAENLQSRIRGTLLMAVANQEGQLLLTTGNKSELGRGVLHPLWRYEWRLSRDRRPLQNQRIRAL